MDNTGQGVAESLAGSSLRDPNKVVTLERDGEALRLDGRGGGEPGVTDLLHDVVGEVPVLPRHDGVGAGLFTFDDDDLILMP